MFFRQKNDTAKIREACTHVADRFPGSGGYSRGGFVGQGSSRSLLPAPVLMRTMQTADMFKVGRTTLCYLFANYVNRALGGRNL